MFTSMIADFKNRQRILLLIPNLGSGGAQKIFMEQFEFLSEHYNVTGCVFNWDETFESDKRANIVSLDVPAGGNVISKLYFFWLRIVRLRKLKTALRIRICISHLEGADYINILSRKSDRVICWIHGSKLYDLNIRGLQGIIRKKVLIPFLYKRADRLITVSKGIAEELSAHSHISQQRVRVIYNGFDSEKITELSRETLELSFERIFAQHEVIISHGRLAPQKNLHSLLHIFNQLKAKRNLKLVIVGDGELRESLLTECSNLGLNTWSVWNEKEPDQLADVFFTGQQANPFRYLRFASLFIMTSRWEGFPLALCEAMACKLPVIVSDCFTGPREIIAPEIQLPQPVDVPYSTPYGVLMPLISLEDSHAIRIWIETLEQYLDTLARKNEHGVTRIQAFDIKTSRELTLQVVNELEV